MNTEEAYMLGVAQTSFKKKYKQDKHNLKIKRVFIWTILIIAVTLCLFIATINVSVCFDDAMSPLIGKGEIVFTNKIAYLINDVERGDVISFTYTDSSGNSKTLQRRIIAFPGETVEITDGNLYIDGTLCEENYISGTTESDMTSVTVPNSCYYVLSDNRDEGPDSRDGTYASYTSIIGEELISFSF